MKRDMDLVRKILIAVEDNEDDPRAGVQIELNDYSKRQISYHVMLLHEAGMLEAEDFSHLGTDDGFEWVAKRLTWAGHEFVENARNDTIWRSAKSVAFKAGGISLDVFKEILVGCAKQYIKENFGLSAA